MIEESQKKKYKEAFKATSIFGGAQVFIILINILRAKVVALMLGTSGFGIYNLFNTPILLLSTISSLGLPFSAVRDISHAHSTNDPIRVSKTIKTFRRLVWLTSSFGALLMVIFSKQLSIWSFKSPDYQIGFAFASLILFFVSISNAQLSILRGVRRIKEAAIATVFSSTCGLIASLPLFYYFGEDGIVPSLIFGALATLLVSFIFVRRIKCEPVEMSWKESFQLGSDMVKIGFLVTVSSIVTQVAGWIIYLFISRVGGLAEVGLYAAGWAMTNQYTGMVFSAMGADYLPRLSAIKDDNAKISVAANQQSEIALLILGPAMILFLSMLPVAIYILFTSDFLKIITFVQWMLLGMSLKAVSWTLGFIILAKGDGKIFFLTEVGIKFISIPSYLLGYYFWGLEGIGIAFCIVYASYLTLMSVLCIKKYDYEYSLEHKKIFVTTILFTILAFLPLYIWSFPVAYFTGTTVFITSAIYSVCKLNKRIDIYSTLSKMKGKILAKLGYFRNI